MIKRDIVDLITDTSRIDEVVGDFVNLKKRGSNLIGLCPFHNEKTPSFNVNPSRNIYKCFGCGKGGDSVSFIMEHEQASYPEALRYLAGKYNIEIEEDDSSPERTAEELLRESLWSVTSFAQKFFSEQLTGTDEGRSVGVSYFRERDISDHSIDKFQLGYSPDAWSSFTEAALGAGYKIEYLEKTGLTIVKESKQYDRFRGRVIFPIHSVAGKVIGFGGRTLRKDPKIPKYVNSPESEIYHKGKVLYGIYFAKKAISQLDECYLVEGYTDVISMHQSGVENVVASSGTALTPDQIRLISRYTKNVTMLFDGDQAGIKASLRGVDLILEQGLNVKVVAFPEGEDPDSFARAHSNTEVRDYLAKNAVNFIRFKTSLLLGDVHNDPIGKTKLIREIMQTISLIPDPISRSAYVKECSVLMEMDEQVLIQELNKIIRNRFSTQHRTISEPVIEETLPKEPEKNESDDIYHHELNIIRLLLNFGDKEIGMDMLLEEGEETGTELRREVRSFIIQELVADDIYPGEPLFRKIFEEVENAISANQPHNTDHFIRHEDDEVRQLAANLLSEPYSVSNNWNKKGISVSSEEDVLHRSVVGSITTLKMGRIERMIRENREKLKDASDDQMEKLIEKQKVLDSIRSELASTRGIVVMK
jgi:DNA primase